MKIYISIPITHRDLGEVRAHIERTKAHLREAYPDAEIISPLDIPCEVENPEYEDYIAKDFAVLLKCDAIFFCHGWAESYGCQMEMMVAKLNNERRIKELLPQRRLLFEERDIDCNYYLSNHPEIY